MALFPIRFFHVGRRDRLIGWVPHAAGSNGHCDVHALCRLFWSFATGFPFIAPDPFQIPQGDYAGPMGIGEPPSWEKAAMYVVMCSVLITSGGGPISVDLLLIAPRLQQFLT